MKPKAVCWFSSAERYFQTRVSIESFHEHHGRDDIAYYLLFCDSPREAAKLAFPWYVKVVFPEEMHPHYAENIHRFGRMGGFPRCLITDHALRQGHSKIITLDGDMETFAPLDDIYDYLDTHDAVVTPHRLYPPPRDGKAMCLEQFALCGNYNAGFVAFSNRPQATEFVDWWLMESLYYPECNMSQGRFAEQGWLRFVGDYVDKVKILRDQGVNFAFWRYDGNNFTTIDGKHYCDGTPLRLFHYGALDFKDLGSVAVHHSRCRACPDLLAFFEAYKAKVEAVKV